MLLKVPMVLEGVEGVQARFDKLERIVVDNERPRILIGARIIQLEISRLAPYDSDSERNMAKKYSPGKHLKDNISISGFLTDGAGRLYVLVGPAKGDNNDFFYGKFFEWGTSKMNARPFVEPAVIAKRKEAIAAMAQELRRAILNV